MIAKTVIHSNESGWVVILNGDAKNFHPFLSNEPERFIRFITEEVAGISIDEVVQHRLAEIEKARGAMDRAGH